MREGRHGHRGPHHHGEHHGPKGGRGRGEEDKKHFRSAQTFRRGRAVAFLERLEVKRTTLVQQLEQPEYIEIKSVISGELKATDAIIQEFIHMFELQEWQEAPQNQQADTTTKDETETDVSSEQQTEDQNQQHTDQSVMSALTLTESAATEQTDATTSTEAATNHVANQESESTTVAPSDALEQENAEFNPDSASSTTSTSKSNHEQ